MSELDDFGKIKASLREHGLKGPIIKCRLEWLSGKPIKIVNGHKREFLCRKFNIPIKEEILVAQSPEDYLRFLDQFKEPVLTPKQKEAWANYYAEELYEAGYRPGQICRMVTLLVEAPMRSVYRWLHDKYKDPVKQEAGSCCQNGSKQPNNLPLHPKGEYSFIDKVLWLKVWSKIEERYLYQLLDSVRDHFLTVKNNLVLKNASVEELSDVLLEKLEDSKTTLPDEIVARLRAMLPEE